MQVNILEAKTNLSNLVKLVETGKEERHHYCETWKTCCKNGCVQ